MTFSDQLNQMYAEAADLEALNKWVQESGLEIAPNKPLIEAVKEWLSELKGFRAAQPKVKAKGR